METRFDDLFRTIFKRNQILNEEVSEVKEFCNTVYAKHFTYRQDLREDLIQEGLVGILRLVNSCEFDKDKSAINYAYTRVRNCMSNFLNKKTPELMEEVFISDSPDIGDTTKTLSIIDDIKDYIAKHLDLWEVDENLSFYIKMYFNNKFGIFGIVPEPIDVSVDFVVKYDYYINLFEYLIAEKFLNSNVLSTPISDIMDLLECEGDICNSIRLLYNTFDKKTFIKLLYVLSGKNIRFPSKMKLLRTDNNLLLYRSIISGRFTKDEASTHFEKTHESINSLIKKINKAFSYDQRKSEKDTEQSGFNELEF